MTSSMISRARSAPLVTISAFGFGPLGVPRPGDPAQRFETMSGSLDGYQLAVESAGVIGIQVLSVVLAYGGSISDEQFRFQVRSANLDQVAAELERLSDANLLELDSDGSINLSAELGGYLGSAMVSMNDQHATTSDLLAKICRTLQLKAPPRKGDRIGAIADHFESDEGRQLVRKQLGPRAMELLADIVAAAGPSAIPTESIGISRHLLHTVVRESSMYGAKQKIDPDIEPLADLVAAGVVGLSPWEGNLWIWKEALPLLETPFFDGWEATPRPDPIPVSSGPEQVPPIVTIVDRALSHWADSPPKALKNDEARLAKATVRATAKALGTDQETIDLTASLVIDIGLLLRNTVSVSGRGRKRTVDQVWLADPDLAAAWDESQHVDRWARLVAAWTNPDRYDGIHQLLLNRHLVLWELTALDRGEGYADDDTFYNWFGDRHASIGLAEAARDVVADLRRLGLVSTDGPLALTEAARRLLDDPTALPEALGPTEDSVVVQGDLTVLVPPGLTPEIYARLTNLAIVESSGTAQVLRLDERLITKTVQAGSSAEDIIAFLDEISSVSLVDTVTRLVGDAAARADRVRLMAASSVVVFSDPADLTLACSIKSAKLTPVSETVAISTLSVDKLRPALDRKGLAPPKVDSPGLEGDKGSTVVPRSAASEVGKLRSQAERARRFARDHDSEAMEARADDLDKRAAELASPRRRLTASGPLTVTPAVLSLLDPA